jgi:hypothetical protein
MSWKPDDGWVTFILGVAVVAFLVWGIFFWDGNDGGSTRPTPCASIVDDELYAACLDQTLDEPGEPLAPMAP